MTQSPKEKFQFSRRDFLKVSAVAGMAMAGGGFVYGGIIEPSTTDLTFHTIPIQGLAEPFEGYRIVQLSDLHMGSWLTRERLAETVDLINAQKPDLVAITGDFVTLGSIDPVANDLIDTLTQLQATDGVVGVLGNHDHWKNAPQISEVLRTANVIELPNDSIVIERDRAQLTIAGLDDVWESKNDLDKLLSTMPDDVPAVLLAHEPDIADETSATGRFGLQISGHSHGGQIQLPLIGAPYLPWLGQKYPIGRYQVGNMVQYTNRGIGMTFPPVRVGCPPEISIFELSTQQT